MIEALKRVGWEFLALVLSWGSTLIRRRPAGSGPAAWRAVQFSYSHFGEDLVVLRLLQESVGDRGWYVDVGAFDPVLHSNTFLLYLHGWRGLNIDVNAERLAQFNAARSGDTNVVAAVSDVAGDGLYLQYPTPGTNRMVPLGEAASANTLGERPTAALPVPIVTLSSILERNPPPAQGIDFLNIDCEGWDLAVLRGLDWSRWTPRVIAVEGNTPADREALSLYLAAHGYHLLSQHLVTLIFVHESAGAPGLPRAGSLTTRTGGTAATPPRDESPWAAAPRPDATSPASHPPNPTRICKSPSKGVAPPCCA